VVIHYEEALYQVYAPLPLHLSTGLLTLLRRLGRAYALTGTYWCTEAISVGCRS